MQYQNKNNKNDKLFICTERNDYERLLIYYNYIYIKIIIIYYNFIYIEILIIKVTRNKFCVL